MRCAVLSEHLPNLHISLDIPRANENGTCINLALAEMRVITVISISPIWKSIESYHLGNIVWPMRCAVLSEHLPNLHISLHIPVWIVPYEVFTNHLKECVFTPRPFRPNGCCDCLCLSVCLVCMYVRLSVLFVCLSVCQSDHLSMNFWILTRSSRSFGHCN